MRALERVQQRPDVLIGLNSITLTAGWRTKGASVEVGKSVRLCINPGDVHWLAPGWQQ